MLPNTPLALVAALHEAPRMANSYFLADTMAQQFCVIVGAVVCVDDVEDGDVPDEGLMDDISAPEYVNLITWYTY